MSIWLILASCHWWVGTHLVQVQVSAPVGLAVGQMFFVPLVPIGPDQTACVASTNGHLPSNHSCSSTPPQPQEAPASKLGSSAANCKSRSRSKMVASWSCIRQHLCTLNFNFKYNLNSSCTWIVQRWTSSCTCPPTRFFSVLPVLQCCSRSAKLSINSNKMWHNFSVTLRYRSAVCTVLQSVVAWILSIIL